MAATHEDREAIPQLFYQALQQVMHANIAPMLALWSEQDDVTYYDPNGHPHQGRDGLVTYWQRAANALIKVLTVLIFEMFLLQALIES